MADDINVIGTLDNIVQRTARDMVFGDIGSLHDCPLFTTETRRLSCGCAPGRCQQREADEGERG